MKQRIFSIKAFFFDKLANNNERSLKAKNNIIASIFIRMISIAISLLIVPLTLNYITPSEYGIWITLSSIVAWFIFFDVGLTQGLRNKFAEAKAKGDHNLARIYVSTTYAILITIFSIVWCIFLVINRFLNWSQILNISETMQSEISILAVIVFTYFCLQFILRIITTIILADQQPAKSSLIDLLGQIVSAVVILVLVKTTNGSLVNLGIALCVSPILVLVGANIFFFKGSLTTYSPSLSKVHFGYSKKLFSLGAVFFIIQIAAIIQYETANIIIARNFGTAEVTSYNIVFKYFGMLNMIFVIFLTPFWSASTEAFLNNDIQWIKNAMKKYHRLNFILILCGILMLILSETVYRLWLGENKVIIGFYLSMWGFIYFSVTMFGGKYVYFLNGINALRIQFWASIISPFIYVAVAYLLILQYKMGICSLFIASIIANFNGLILSPLQYHMIIYKNKKGLWLK